MVGKERLGKVADAQEHVELALSRTVRRTRKAPVPTWFGPPQVRAGRQRRPDEDRRLVPQDGPRRGRPRLLASGAPCAGRLAGPSVKLSSTQPQTNRARVKAR